MNLCSPRISISNKADHIGIVFWVVHYLGFMVCNKYSSSCLWNLGWIWHFRISALWLWMHFSSFLTSLYVYLKRWFTSDQCYIWVNFCGGGLSLTLLRIVFPVYMFYVPQFSVQNLVHRAWEMNQSHYIDLDCFSGASDVQFHWHR